VWKGRYKCTVTLSVALVAALAGCGEGKRTDRCLHRLEGVRAVGRTVGDQVFVRFADGSAVGLVRMRTANDAARIATGAGGPGDPYAYEAVGPFVVAWRGDQGNRHLRAVVRCLR